MSRKPIFLIIVSTLISGMGILWLTHMKSDTPTPSQIKGPLVTNPVPTLTPTPTPTPTLTPTPHPQSEILIHNAPFTSQAPSFQWDNDMFQFACEEASIIMAMAWVNNEVVLPIQKAEEDIINLSNFALETVGSWHDESAQDTALIIKKYYQHDQVNLIKDATAQDIINSLYANGVVIAPMNGRLLKNPHYTQPGPIEHMLLIIGYDPTTDEFITNDPGTRLGKHYRYNTRVFENAIQDYPTGYHEVITEIKKPIIVVGKN